METQGLKTDACAFFQLRPDDLLHMLHGREFALSQALCLCAFLSPGRCVVLNRLH